MQLFKTIRLVWTFYRNFIFLSSIITVICLRAFWLLGWASFFGIFWSKILTMALIYYFININKKKEYYYYQNLGISKTLLWTASLTFDFILFIFLLILTYFLR